MNRITTSLLAACLTLGTAAAFAQDAAPKTSGQSMSGKGCKDSMSTPAGRTDRSTTATTPGCANAMATNTKMKKHTFKEGSAKTKDADTSHEAPVAPAKQ